jgi:hypothetical protein
MAQVNTCLTSTRASVQTPVLPKKRFSEVKEYNNYYDRDVCPCTAVNGICPHWVTRHSGGFDSPPGTYRLEC